MKKYLLPLGILLCLSLGERYVVPLFSTSTYWLIIIIRAALLFSFGLALNVGKRRKYESWLRKVIISFVVIFFLVWELGFIMIPQLKTIFNALGLYAYIVYLIYIYCGWSFFD